MGLRCLAALGLLLPSARSAPRVAGSALAALDASDADRPRDVYVFGPESSGTRFLSRTIAGVVTGWTTLWDGEFPSCWSESKPWTVQHISLPWGSTCQEHKGEPDRIEDAVDMCASQPGGRWFANVTSALLAHTEARAVAIVREEQYTLPSVLEHHCDDRGVALAQNVLARQLIDEAVAPGAAGGRVLRVSYEAMSSDGRAQWSRIFDHLGVTATADDLDRAVADWVDGDAKYGPNGIANGTAALEGGGALPSASMSASTRREAANLFWGAAKHIDVQALLRRIIR